MSKLARGLTLSAAAGAALYVGFAAWAGWYKVGAALSDFAWSTAAAGAGLAAVNYLIRFVKWEFYLARLGLRVPRGRSLAIFLAGFSLTVTPGKIGEVLKSYLLRETDGIPMARTAPIVVAERVTDLIALLLLAVIGAGSLGASQRILWIGGALVASLVLVVAVRPLGEAAIATVGRLPLGRKIAPKLNEFYGSTRELLAPLPLVVATAISIVAWACECVSFWLILGGFPGAAVPLIQCTFIYAAMTIAGALSFLPGGLGVQEGGMVALLVAASRGVGEPTAFAATFVTRLCTLWFAVLVGIIALAVVRKRSAVAVDVGALKAARK
ncbi:MAG: flippase-like domain-containing protein [Myxococcales bacterium]|nr:flippase-like domain-containing protein [Myxococcales bacterium]